MPAAAGTRAGAGASWACALAAAFAAAWFAVNAIVQASQLGWDPDMALYILHARNLALGLPYAETGYIFNPLNAIHPAAYPPGLPLLLAPVYRLWGLDLAVMKAVVCLSFALFLFVFFHIARLYVGAWTALAVIGIVSANSFFRDFATFVYSEYPFLLLALAGLLLVYRIQQPGVLTASGRIGHAIAAGLLLGFAIETRSVGLLLLPVVFLAALVRVRRAGPGTDTGGAALAASVAAAVVAVACTLAIDRLLPHDGGTYLSYFSDYSVSGLARGLALYAGTLPLGLLGLWRFPLTDGASVLLSGIGALVVAAALGLAVFGFGSVSRSRPSVFEVFTLAYAAFIIVYPIREEPARYALPVYPLIILYAAVGWERATDAFARWPTRAGARWLTRAGARWPRRALAGAGLAAVALVMTAPVLSLPAGERRPWVLEPEERALFGEIVRQTPPDAVVLAKEPTSVALFTGRRSAIWPAGSIGPTTSTGPAGSTRLRQAFWDYAGRIGATHVAAMHLDDIPLDAEPGSGPHLQPLYATGEVALYRIRR